MFINALALLVGRLLVI